MIGLISEKIGITDNILIIVLKLILKLIATEKKKDFSCYDTH